MEQQGLDLIRFQHSIAKALGVHPKNEHALMSPDRQPSERSGWRNIHATKRIQKKRAE